MINPCIDFCYHRYGRQYSQECDDKCEYAKLIKEKSRLESNEKSTTLEDFSVEICSSIECSDCPVIKENYEKRTGYDVYKEPCCNNLYKWIIEKVKATNNEK